MYQLTFTNEFLMDLITKLMDTGRARKMSYVSFEPDPIGGGMMLIVKYKELYAGDEWIDQRVIMPIKQVG